MDFRRKMGIIAVALLLTAALPMAAAFALTTETTSKNDEKSDYMNDERPYDTEGEDKPTEKPGSAQTTEDDDNLEGSHGDKAENSSIQNLGNKSESNQGAGSGNDLDNNAGSHSGDGTNSGENNGGSSTGNTGSSTGGSTGNNSLENSKDNLDKNTENKCDYSVPVPKSEEVGNDYFKDAIFIGNSQIEGFALYSGLSDIRAYFGKGIMVDTVFTKPVIKRNDTKVPIMDAIATDADFSKAYIMLGMNELGWVSIDIFTEKYAKIIDALRDINPNVLIYVQSILPVTKSKSDQDKLYNNQRINKFNDYIRSMCKEKEVYYLNVAQAVSNEYGVLPEEAAFDGVHLKMKYCQKWLEYLKNHTVTEVN